MRKKLKIILLLLSIMAVMCVFVGCGDGKQDDSALFSERDNQSADTAGADNDEKQENNTKDGQSDTEKDQTEGKQDKSEGETSDKSADAVGNQAANGNSAADESTGSPSNIPVGNTSGTSTGETDELSVDVECLNYAKQIAQNENCYKMMLLTGSKKESTLEFYRQAGYNSEDKTAFIQWL